MLRLPVKDREVLEALRDYPDGPARQEFALTALKIGVSALRLASGRLDAELIQREGAQVLRSLAQQLHQHTEAVHERVNSRLKEYFDPENGRFNERVKRLVSHDGELEQLLRRQIGREDSELAKTLLAHFGDRSPLMKRLSPTESEGVLAAPARRGRGATDAAARAGAARVLAGQRRRRLVTAGPGNQQ